MWTGLWQIAREETGATPITLIREALFDYPDDDELFSFLDGLAEENIPGWEETAGVFLVQLEKLAPEFEPARVQAAALSLPELPPDQALALIGSTFRAFVAGEHRRLLENCFQQLSESAGALSPGDIAAGVQLLIKLIPNVSELENVNNFGATAGEAVALLKSVPDASPEAVMKIVNQAAEKITALKALPVASGEPYYDAALSGIERQMACLIKCINAEPVPPVEGVCRACVHLIWATVGLFAEDAEEMEERAGGEGADAPETPPEEDDT